MNLSENEVYQIAFNRNVSENLLKETQIKAAYMKWLTAYIGDTFLDIVKDDDDAVNNYLKPIWAWGVVYSNFHYIATNITDKGIVAMLIEGTASLISMDKMSAAKAEILDNIMSLLKLFNVYATENYPDDYEGLVVNPYPFGYFGNERLNQTPY